MGIVSPAAGRPRARALPPENKPTPPAPPTDPHVVVLAPVVEVCRSCRRCPSRVVAPQYILPSYSTFYYCYYFVLFFFSSTQYQPHSPLLPNPRTSFVVSARLVDAPGIARKCRPLHCPLASTVDRRKQRCLYFRRSSYRPRTYRWRCRVSCKRRCLTANVRNSFKKNLKTYSNRNSGCEFVRV